MAGSATPTIDTSSASRNRAPQSTIRMAHNRGLQCSLRTGEAGASGRELPGGDGLTPGRAAGAGGRRDGEGEAAWERLVDSMPQRICMHKH